MDAMPPEVRAYARSIADRIAAEVAEVAGAVTVIPLPFASGQNLMDYWAHGAGAAKVRWGTDGSMDRCIRLNRKHVSDPGGLCATLHKRATGQWPTEGGKAGIPS